MKEIDLVCQDIETLVNEWETNSDKPSGSCNIPKEKLPEPDHQADCRTHY